MSDTSLRSPRVIASKQDVIEELGVDEKNAIQVAKYIDVEENVSEFMAKICEEHEPWSKMMKELIIPFLGSGLGMVFAGVVANIVLAWEVFLERPEYTIVMVPLIGLKGDLGMTLAARMSTHANMGNLNGARKWEICYVNLILDQFQAIGCGAFAGVMAIFFASMSELSSDVYLPYRVLTLICSSVVTGSVVSLFISTVMISMVLIANIIHVNPDNIATPMAGTCGDLITLAAFALISNTLYRMGNGIQAILIPSIGLFLYCLITLYTGIACYRNEFTKPILKVGWIPLFTSLAASAVGGLLLEKSSDNFVGVGLYQTLVGGIGGNLVSVQISRISTYLHVCACKNSLPTGEKVCDPPWKIFMGKGLHTVSARLLLAISIPGQILFATVGHYASLWFEDSLYNGLFLVLIVVASTVQVASLLYIGEVVSNLCWVCGVDPDVTTIPYLTGIGDTIAGLVVYIAYVVYYYLEPTFIPSTNST